MDACTVKAVCRRYITGEMMRCPAPRKLGKEARRDFTVYAPRACDYGLGIVGNRTIAEVCWQPDHEADKSHDTKCPGCGAIVRVELKDA